MRLRTFTGRSTAEAMAAVRAQLGPDAVIVSAQDDGNGNTRVTAALDEGNGAAGLEGAALDSVLGKALDFHAPPPTLRARLIDAALGSDLAVAAEALKTGLDATLRFAPLGPKDRAIVLVGAPGSGKTVSAAKLATRDVLAGRRVRLITTDLARAGGVGQLETFAKILSVPFATADGPDALGAMVALADGGERLIIDTAGINPFSAGDRREIAALIGASMAEPVLVFAAGCEAADGCERAKIFADLGCARAIVTQLDATRRLGSVLAIAEMTRLAFAEAGIAPDIADGIMSFTPELLAHLLLPKGPP